MKFFLDSPKNVFLSIFKYTVFTALITLSVYLSSPLDDEFQIENTSLCSTDFSTFSNMLPERAARDKDCVALFMCVDTHMVKQRKNIQTKILLVMLTADN